MKLLLKRKWFKETYTIGNLFIAETFFSDTLEDKFRDLSIENKIAEKTAIPYGTYRIAMSWSNRFSRIMPELLYVPFFEGIRIHAGNTESDTSGCILVGRNDVIGKLTRSKYYSDKLNEFLMASKEKIFIEITQ